MSKPRVAPAAQVHALRQEPWGRISLVEPGLGAPAQLLEKWTVPLELRDGVLAMAQRWAEVAHPCVLSYQLLDADATHVARAAVCPSGPSLAVVLRKVPKWTVRAAATLFVDLGEALLELHGLGLVAGSLAPECLVVCPVGLDREPALTLVHAGLTQLLQAAGVPQPVQLPQGASVQAPEVAGGEWPSAAADVYQFAACLAMCLALCLGDDAGDLLPLVRACQEPEESSRIVALHALVAALREATAAAPRVQLGERSLVAAWERGSPLVALAPWVPAEPWYRGAHDQQVGTARDRAVATAAPVTAPVAGPDAAKLQAAIGQLRALHQLDEPATTRTLPLRTVVLIAAVVVAGALWILAKQVGELRDVDAAAQAQLEQQDRRPPPPRPKPRMLTPEDGLFGP